MENGTLRDNVSCTGRHGVFVVQVEVKMVLQYRYVHWSHSNFLGLKRKSSPGNTGGQDKADFNPAASQTPSV
ncbi:hypothetical protein JOB18_048653 [Solea senegalensis]|uniref:Uncharacterized protein n=1 Tax=Solea senegalensis TaxID=28829 RepID=A0AAV6QAN3_SOLSE|nr:hypothetical protein JOB18_048653 [Solea senegalensis]